ncbi:MAG: hypothetical protein FWE45_05225 [Firmicutes bacterium]|nr:hypothetical protein [Bacillota bacterium]
MENMVQERPKLSEVNELFLQFKTAHNVIMRGGENSLSMARYEDARNEAFDKILAAGYEVVNGQLVEKECV